MAMDAAYRYDVIYYNPCNDPTAGPDPFSGQPVLTFADQAGQAFTSKFVWLFCKDNNSRVRMRYDNSSWGDAFLVYDGNQPMPLFFNAQAMQVVNAVSGSNAEFQGIILA